MKFPHARSSALTIFRWKSHDYRVYSRVEKVSQSKGRRIPVPRNPRPISVFQASRTIKVTTSLANNIMVTFVVHPPSRGGVVCFPLLIDPPHFFYEESPRPPLKFTRNFEVYTQLRNLSVSQGKFRRLDGNTSATGVFYFRATPRRVKGSNNEL